MLSTVVLLNSVPFPLTSAFCSSVPVIVPDLFVSTLTKPTDSSPRYTAYVIHFFVVVKIFTFQSSSSVGPLLACLVGVGLVCEAWTSTSWSDGTTKTTHVLLTLYQKSTTSKERWRQCNCGVSGVGLMDGQLSVPATTEATGRGLFLQGAADSQQLAAAWTSCHWRRRSLPEIKPSQPRHTVKTTQICLGIIWFSNLHESWDQRKLVSLEV